MTYQISYYHDRAMQHPQADQDNIGQIDTYPAPTGHEAAFARHASDQSLSRYGYDGAWRETPPREVAEVAQKLAAEWAAQEKAAEFAAQPHAIGRLAHDHNTFLIQVPGQPEPAYLQMEELRQAAIQDDPDGRAVYARLLAEIEGKLVHEWR